MSVNCSSFYGFSSLLERLMNQENPVVISGMGGTGPGHFPPAQVFEDEAAVHVRVFVPGVSPETFSAEYADGKLVLAGNIPTPEGRPHRRERPSGPFRRELKLPRGIAGENIQAAMRNGILSIVLPRRSGPAKRSIVVTFSQDVAR